MDEEKTRVKVYQAYKFFDKLFKGKRPSTTTGENQRFGEQHDTSGPTRTYKDMKYRTFEKTNLWSVKNSKHNMGELLWDAMLKCEGIDQHFYYYNYLRAKYPKLGLFFIDARGDFRAQAQIDPRKKFDGKRSTVFIFVVDDDGYDNKPPYTSHYCLIHYNPNDQSFYVWDPDGEARGAEKKNELTYNRHKNIAAFVKRFKDRLKQYYKGPFETLSVTQHGCRLVRTYRSVLLQ